MVSAARTGSGVKSPAASPVHLADALRRAQAGDADAFEALYRAHVGRVHALCFRMAGDAVHARELVQDVFVRAWEKLGTFRGESDLGSWLHRIAVNVVLMDKRLAARRAEDSLDADEMAGQGIAARGPSDDLRVDLDHAIASLPPGARQVLVLHDVEGFGHKEISGMLHIAEGTCRAHLFRARRLLRERLER